MNRKNNITLNFIRNQQKREYEIHAKNLMKIYTKMPGEKISAFKRDFNYSQNIRKLREKKRLREMNSKNKRINRQNKVLLSRIKNIEKRDGTLTSQVPPRELLPAELQGVGLPPQNQEHRLQVQRGPHPPPKQNDGRAAAERVN